MIVEDQIVFIVDKEIDFSTNDILGIQFKSTSGAALQEEADGQNGLLLTAIALAISIALLSWGGAAIAGLGLGVLTALGIIFMQLERK